MKKLFTLALFCNLFSFVQAQTTVNVCAGTNYVIQATNPLNLSNPSYTLLPNNTPAPGGSYTVNVTVTTTYTMVTGGLDAQNNPQTSSAVITLSVLPQPQFTPTYTQPSCTSTVSAVNLGLSFGSSPTPAYTVSWTPLPASVLSAQQTTATGLTPGPYTVTATGAGGCFTSVFFTMLPTPQPASFALSPAPGYTLNCYNPTLTVHATAGSYNYTWTSTSSSPITSTTVNLTASNVGNWTIVGVNPVSGCISTLTFAVNQNFTTPSSLMTPSAINISCTQTNPISVSVTASPSINITHQITAPTGGVFVANSYTAIYTPGGTGTYTYCLFNNTSGCSTCKNFTVTSSDFYPTYSVSALPGFTLGCSSKSITAITINNGSSTIPPGGGVVSYTILSPGSPNPSPGPITPISVYTVNIPGTYTVLVRDNTNQCETRTPISIIQNVTLPDISVNVPQQVLDCRTTTMTLNGLSTNASITYTWLAPGSSAQSTTNPIFVSANSAAPTTTNLGNYVFMVTDLNNACKSTTVVTVYQNLFPPKANIATMGTPVLTCTTPTVILVNQSTTGIPAATGFPANLPVIAKEWHGPLSYPLSSTYTASAPGVYTLDVIDLNNGCTSNTTIVVTDNRLYPVVNIPEPALLPCPGVVAIYPVIMGSSTNFSYAWSTVPGATVSGVNTATIVVNAPGTYTLLITNTSTGCQTKMTYPVYACVGLRDNGALEQIMRIFPNPGTGLFTIKRLNNQANCTIGIYNAMGVLIRTELLSQQEMTIDIREQAAGLYFIYVIDNNKKTAVGKIIKN